jgi:catechol 2,3-dioxygenase-like lactoylglutathione lyase family enzyme
MSADARLRGVTLDCPDPAALADFYHRLTGLAVAFSTEAYAGLAGPGGGPGIGFQRVEGHRAPTWPGHDVPQQFHLDFTVPDVAEAEKHAVEAGARVPAEQPGGERWRVLVDPAGHPFCLIPTG